MRIGKWLIGAGLAITMFASVSRASSFDLNIANFTGYSGPYQSVTVSLANDHQATITFDALQQGNYIYFFSEVAVNINAGSWTVSTPITATNTYTNTSPGTYGWLNNQNNPDSGTMDGFGSFNQIVSPAGSQGSSNPAAEVKFTVTDNDVAGWASASDVLTGNDPSSLTANYVAAAHTLVFSYTAPSTYTAVNVTGFTTGVGGFNDVPSVPLPSGAWGTLVLLGILGLGRKFVFPRAV
jgi:hypothetical protein